ARILARLLAALPFAFSRPYVLPILTTLLPRLADESAGVVTAALDALGQDAWLQQAVGEAACGQLLAIKRAEWDQWHAQVSDWELERYAAG
ncbi:MAG: hypothetical protein ACK40L_16365, partial [Hydrogenophaga sp.]